MVFVKPETFSGHLFEFSDFIAALAILIVILTMTDIRYRFRVSVAPFPILGTTYCVAFCVGLVLLASQFFYYSGWRFPSFLASPLELEFWSGLIFFLSIFLWISYAFIKYLSVFRKLNARQFYAQIERHVLRGLDSDLPVIADELGRSGRALVILSMTQEEAHRKTQKKKTKWKWIKSEEYAYRLLFIMSNKKFCRHIALTSPWTAITIFANMSDQKKYDLPVNEFAVNIFYEALINEESILYHENDRGNNGLIGNYRPFTESLFSDYDLITALKHRGLSPFYIDYRLIREWSGRQLQIYCKCVLVFSKSFFSKMAENKILCRSFAYCDALKIIKDSCEDLRTLNNTPDYFNTEAYRRFAEAVRFIGDTFALLNEEVEFPVTSLRKNTTGRLGDIYDDLSQLMFDIIFLASYIKEPSNACWYIHYSLVFETFFLGFCHQSSPVKIIRHRLRRKLFDEIKQLNHSPRYGSARILRYCLNVQGLDNPKKSRDFDFCYPLKRAVLSWVKINFLKLYRAHPEIANYCLPIEIALDIENHRLVQTCSNLLNNPGRQIYFDLIP